MDSRAVGDLDDDPVSELLLESVVTVAPEVDGVGDGEDAFVAVNDVVTVAAQEAVVEVVADKDSEPLTDTVLESGRACDGVQDDDDEVVPAEDGAWRGETVAVTVAELDFVDEAEPELETVTVAELDGVGDDELEDAPVAVNDNVTVAVRDAVVVVVADEEPLAETVFESDVVCEGVQDDDDEVVPVPVAEGSGVAVTVVDGEALLDTVAVADVVLVTVVEALSDGDWLPADALVVSVAEYDGVVEAVGEVVGDEHITLPADEY